MVFQEADLSVRVVRDIFSDQFEKAIVDDEKQHHRLSRSSPRTAPELVERVERYEGDEPLFEAYDVDKEINSTLSRRVDLPSGGYLIIDYAEAMTVIDINSGSFTGRGKGARLEDTITKTNLEAAEEVVRQLRLRDIGGIIVIDFIDMARATQPRRGAEDAAQHARGGPHQDLRHGGLAARAGRDDPPERHRRRARDPHQDAARSATARASSCPRRPSRSRSSASCATWSPRSPKPKAFLIQVHPRVSNLLVNGPGRPLLALEDEVNKHFHFEGKEALPIDTFKVLMEGTLDSISERALPFREGEEVLVKIEEPHMYNEDDAVAKIDGYLIWVTARGATSASRSSSGSSASGAPRPCVAGRQRRGPAAPRPRRRRRLTTTRRRSRSARAAGAAAAGDARSPRATTPIRRPPRPRPPRRPRSNRAPGLADAGAILRRLRPPPGRPHTPCTQSFE